MYENVLVPTDGGKRMDTVTDRAIDIAQTRDATLHAVSVVDQRAFLTLDDELETEVAAELERDAAAAVDGVATKAADAGVAVETTTRRGKPVDEILAAATDAEADLIVAGSRGAENYEANLLGSVSEGLVNAAACPVLIVPIGDS